MFELFRFYKHMYVLLFDNNTCTQVVICLKKLIKKMYVKMVPFAYVKTYQYLS